jgi:pyruvate dehydrogenase E2 component (dihydrolipoamide acetyltransferase)
MSGGTFTISNLGMYSIDAFTPIINQPESAILGVGRIHEKPVGVGGEIVLRPMMTLSLSFDHRVIDGAPAAAFLQTVKEVLENPYQMMV